MPRSNGNDPIRITRTSGTTGATKTLIVPRRQNDARLEHYAVTYGFDTGSRYLVTMALSVFPIYAAIMACLRSGGTVIYPQEHASMALQLTGRGITHVALTPLHLTTILDTLSEDFPKPERLTIYAFGAGVSAALRARALDRLATRIFGSYGCNEAGFISVMRPGDESGSSTIWPGVDVDIVGEDDLPLPSGTVGRIRVRSQFMVEGYLDDPDATRRMFKDGWFYPGDSGVVETPGRLKVLGRTDDLLNIGGIKHPPEELERSIAREAAVLDVGVCSLRNGLGIEEVYVAVVGAEVGNEELEKSVLRGLRDTALGTIRIFRVDAIPRNDLGKILRERLRDSLRAALHDHS
ncbi:MAG TPA: fatty acid--CoA ligase family protein [Stellaceae bacterium]|nr:fatty acid--CoA ligase family protein [Stellaceae bacterium]